MFLEQIERRQQERIAQRRKDARKARREQRDPNRAKTVGLQIPESMHCRITSLRKRTKWPLRRIMHLAVVRGIGVLENSDVVDGNALRLGRDTSVEKTKTMGLPVHPPEYRGLQKLKSKLGLRSMKSVTLVVAAVGLPLVERLVEENRL